ncbi:hypothetical protein [Haloferula sp. A504]|uniref:hypothetical protein n=1 Tax=Haloferula sp. A504 TaxID=3373601 RepID=UPI0031C7B96E|nr:hypothetical protein [Verrucomicrobiaceae bacterium E54]
MKVALTTLAFLGCRDRAFRELDLLCTVEGGEPMELAGRPATQEMASSHLLDFNYYATISHGYFESEPDTDADYLAVSIRYPSGTGPHMSMSKMFSLEDLPEDILSRRSTEIVTMTNDAIIFDLGTITVTSPKPWRR